MEISAIIGIPGRPEKFTSSREIVVRGIPGSKQWGQQIAKAQRKLRADIRLAALKQFPVSSTDIPLKMILGNARKREKPETLKELVRRARRRKLDLK